MRKKVLTLLALICCFVMALGVFVACNDDTDTYEEPPAAFPS